MKKLCNRCGEIKPFSDFHKNSKRKDGLQTECKACVSERNRKWYVDNIERAKEARKKYYGKNKQKIHKRQKIYELKNRDKILARNKEYNESHKEEYKAYYEKNKEKIANNHRKYQRDNKDKIHKWQKKYRENHKEQIKESAKRYREENKEKINQAHLKRLHSDPNYKLKEQTRNMLRCSLRERGHKKSSKTKDIVGCDLDFLCNYLYETWENNYGKKWNGEKFHIDHIIPLSTAKTKEDIIKLCHYTNLQLLTPEDNMAKSDKILTYERKP